MDGLWSRAAGELEKVHLYIYIWCCVVRGMLYCICAFSKCILGDPDVVCDILPDPFRMHNKSQPKANIPSPALHPPGSLTRREDPGQYFAVRFPGVRQLLGVGRAENDPSKVHSSYPARAGLQLLPGSTAFPAQCQDLLWDPPAAPCPTESQGSFSCFLPL